MGSAECVSHWARERNSSYASTISYREIVDESLSFTRLTSKTIIDRK